MDTLKQLEAIPHLATEAYLTWNAPNPGERTGFTKRPRPGSKAPTDLAVLDALRPDPDAEGSSLRGVLSLAVRAVWEDARTEGSPTPDLEPEPTFLSECRWLTETVVFWHSDRWLTEYVTDSVATVHRELAKLVRMPKPNPYQCPKCGEPMFLEPGDYFQCEAVESHKQPGPIALEKQWRRRPTATAQNIIRIFRDEMGVTLTEPQLWQWRCRGKIPEAGRDGRKVLYLPWDVLRVILPEVVEALDSPDRVAL